MGSRRGRHAIHDQTAEGLFDFKLCIEYNDSEADWEDIVAALALEEGADGVQCVPMDLLDGARIRGDV